MVKSKSPNKQRKAQYNAPLHTKRKRVTARLQLDSNDKRFEGIRNITVRVGDTVRVVRGDYAHGGKRERTNEAKTGAILSVNSNTGRLTIEGCTIVNSNNQEEPYPIHVSNVVVTKIDESDKLRVQQLTSKRS
ncbi:MAG: 50S ribosomal protein L24 [Candidatus Thermoplasmatota archaeon]|nr:50S ribosomal protein L24 [Candidatus Thermoplasmatota archaeon]